ncbi:transposase [Corynebacterium casei]|uniref:transposase n=1 Tax=Corynebacterium casei TaxID=160386 RepID=UPI003FD0B7FC
MVKTSVLLATGVNAEGYRELLGMQVATSESASSWTGFFRDLKARGLNEVYLVTSDAHLGIQLAISDVFTKRLMATLQNPFRQEPLSHGPQDSMADIIGDVSHDLPTTRLRISLVPSQ